MISQSHKTVKTMKLKKKKRKIKIEPTVDVAKVRNKIQKQEENRLNWEPPNWRLQLANIKLMRKDKDAPTDVVGCEYSNGKEYSEKEKRFHVLVSLMLSSQTKDSTSHAATRKLLDHGLTIQSIIEISDETLGQLIYPVRFWKTKVSYLKRTSEILAKEYNGDIPDTAEDLKKLPGVGPKMAYLTLTCAWNKVVGIGVDVHVNRTANRLGWVQTTTSNPEKTRKELEDWLPQSLWREADLLLVGFGQQICLPISPKCSECLNKDICPSSTAKLGMKKPKGAT